jgi:hypothetical protein
MNSIENARNNRWNRRLESDLPRIMELPLPSGFRSWPRCPLAVNSKWRLQAGIFKPPLLERQYFQGNSTIFTIFDMLSCEK